jgi:hypothetical protein
MNANRSLQDEFQHMGMEELIDPVLIRNPLKTKLVYILFKNSIRTSKRTPNFTITKTNWLMLFKEIIGLQREPCKTNKYKMQHY